MNISINIDLDAVLAKAISEDKLAAIIEKNLTEAVTSAIVDATSYRSEFRKQLTE